MACANTPTGGPWCWECKYDLTGLPDRGCCPECGSRYNARLHRPVSLREKLAERAKSAKLAAYWPPMEYTGDNAAMVAGLGYHLFMAGAYADLTLEAVP